jgi:hypothetical protein
MAVGDPNKIDPTNDFEIIISGSGPNSQVFVPFNVIAQTPTIRGGPSTDDVGTGSVACLGNPDPVGMKVYAPVGEETFDDIQTTEEAQAGADRREAA